MLSSPTEICFVHSFSFRRSHSQCCSRGSAVLLSFSWLCPSKLDVRANQVPGAKLPLSLCWNKLIGKRRIVTTDFPVLLHLGGLAYFRLDCRWIHITAGKTADVSHKSSMKSLWKELLDSLSRLVGCTCGHECMLLCLSVCFAEQGMSLGLSCVWADRG